MKILLTQPAIGESWLSYNRLYAPNLGLLYLAGYLKKYKPETELKYLEGHMSLDDHVKAVTAYNPVLYGATVTAWALPHAIKGIERVKSVLPGVKIVVGGPYASINPKKALENPAIDYCVIGEGEQTFLELVAYLEGQGDLGRIKGLAYRNSKNEVIINPMREAVEDLDQLPLPDWSLVDHKKYKGPAISNKAPFGHVSAARGCPYNCTFCTANAVWEASGKKFRYRSPEAIAKEVQLLASQYGVREIVLRAPSFNANLQWAKEVCREIKRLRLKDVVFNTELRVDHVDSELAELLRDINMWCVHVGVESACPRVLKGVRKKYTIADVERALKTLKPYGVRVYGYFMMFHFWEDEKGDLQIEQPEEIEGSLNFIRRMGREGLLHHFSWAFCTPYEGSELYQLAVKHGLMENGGPKLSNELSSSLLPGITLSMRNKYRRKGMLLQFWFALRNGDFNGHHIKRGIANLRYVFARNNHEQWKCEQSA